MLAYVRGDATAVRDAFGNLCDVAPPGQLCTVPVTIASVRNLARLHAEAPDAFARLQVSVASWMEWDLLCAMRGIVALDCRGASACNVVLRVQVFTGATQHGAALRAACAARDVVLYLSCTYACVACAAHLEPVILATACRYQALGRGGGGDGWASWHADGDDTPGPGECVAARVCCLRT